MSLARLSNNKIVTFSNEIIASGTSKDIYLTEDGKSVLLFYRSPDITKKKIYHDRLRSIFTQFNLTVTRDYGGAAKDENEALRMKEIFGWPTGVTMTPKLGYQSNVFPDRFWFKTDPRNLPVRDRNWEKAEKKAAWFTIKRVWRTLAKRERGDFKSLLQVCLLLSHGISRLHRMGLAHSDLSSNNVLIDPLIDKNGTGWPGCLIIDIDTLVVPGFYPAAVIGTKGYIAPEVLKTSRLKIARDRKMPCINTDKYALAVLIYEILLNRHPLDGPKMRSDESEEEDEFLAFGQDAIFIESNVDTSNRPKKISISFKDIGGPIANCIEKTFIDGLHNPQSRSQAIEWERALWKTLDLLHPCFNSTCLWRWYVCEDGTKSSCPWCGAHATEGVPELHFIHPNGAPDQSAGKLICWHGRQLHRWHIENNVAAVPFEDNNPCAEIIFDNDHRHWLIKNNKIDYIKIVSPMSKEVHIGQQEVLTDETIMKLGSSSANRIVKFVINKGED